MKASVIIPALNEGEYLGKVLAALERQTFQDFEVIVIDNGSTDSTTNVARSYGVKLISEPRRGTMWACEAGRKIARGNIIVRTDADCLPASDWLLKGLKHFEDPRVVGASGPYDHYDTSFLFRYGTLLIEKYLMRPGNYILQFFDAGAVMVGGNSFMRAEALEKIGGFDTSIVFYGDDVDTAIRLSHVGKVTYDKHLLIKSSGRRFRQEGVLGTQSKYVRAYLHRLFS